ncbi:MAG TPA: hypothetical protein DCS07_09735 [Bdellovibrionales bacterium]|nr:MAG: hypothetical protein A2Z97_08190 [Bdellovibrionales bacterium GWB1_52_6]OFZ03828.1 MAG: hypothetical protein A2X97_15630 [Bdellovibrionales bacterium GWA1_52_35]OFZ39620.1 MAG: hypothetical protein A2070_05945 [Bdellovibrionales bacterium GWC1_52_8]HAR42892.1 hypothetical protein [Bdellovibrionales bacterium]HCM39737.1 hypothetical protein [Bdellovibrionales bacterium]
MEKPLVVTIKHGDESRTRIWRDEKPMAIGHPFRWVLERDGEGVRIRDLANGKGKGKEPFGSISYIEPEVLRSGMAVLLPNSTAAVRFRPAALLSPAFESRPNPNGNIQVYCCMGTWSLGSQRIGDRYVGKVHEQQAFEIRKGAGGYTLMPAVEGMMIETSSGKTELEAGQIRFFSMEELAQLIVRFGLMSWIFSSFENVALPVLTAQSADQQSLSFRKAMALSLAGLTLFGIAAIFWPAPKITDQPLLPQLVTLQVPQEIRKATAAPSVRAAAKSSSKPSQQVQTTTVQAFRAQALNTAMNGLMKGGMTKLLQNSEFMMGSDQSPASRAILNTKSRELHSSSPVTGPIGAKSISVGAIGGGELGKNGATGGVGYGTGDHATVGGQGKSFVSLDTRASDVDEGLSKEEVGAVIHRHLNEIRYCYESAMVHSPSVEGKLLVGFSIAGNGSVRSADVKSSSLSDSGLGDCVLRHLSSWRFPKTKGGINVSVSYPFIFKSLGR